MQNIKRNIAKFLIRRVLVAIATRTRGGGDPRSLLLVVSYCKFAPNGRPRVLGGPPSGAVAPARVSAMVLHSPMRLNFNAPQVGGVDKHTYGKRTSETVGTN